MLHFSLWISTLNLRLQIDFEEHRGTEKQTHEHLLPSSAAMFVHNLQHKILSKETGFKSFSGFACSCSLKVVITLAVTSWIPTNDFIILLWEHFSWLVWLDVLKCGLCCGYVALLPWYILHNQVSFPFKLMQKQAFLWPETASMSSSAFCISCRGMSQQTNHCLTSLSLIN